MLQRVSPLSTSSKPLELKIDPLVAAAQGFEEKERIFATQSLQLIKKSADKINFFETHDSKELYYPVIRTEIESIERQLVALGKLPMADDTLRALRESIVSMIRNPVTAKRKEIMAFLKEPDEKKQEQLLHKTEALYRQQAMIEKEVALKKALTDTLNHISAFVKSNHPSNLNKRCFISYAEPTEELQSKESWLQPFLRILHGHLKAAGLQPILDIIDSRAGDNRYQFMAQIESAEYALSICTESLFLKHHNKKFMAIKTELIHLQRKYDDDIANNLVRVFPLLLSGSHHNAYPEGYQMYSTVRDWRDASYVQNLELLISWIYYPDGTSPEYEAIWQAFYALASKEMQADHHEATISSEANVRQSSLGTAGSEVAEATAKRVSYNPIAQQGSMFMTAPRTGLANDPSNPPVVILQDSLSTHSSITPSELNSSSASLVTAEQSLLLACRQGSLSEVKAQLTLLESKTADNTALTSLHTRACFAAVESNQATVVEYFHEHPSFDLVAAKDKHGNNALHHAVKNGFEKLSLYLIETGRLSPQSTNANNQNALHLAISGGHKNLVHTVVEKYCLPLTSKAYFEEYHLTADALQASVLAGELDILLMLMRKAEPKDLRVMVLPDEYHPLCGNVLHLAIAKHRNTVLRRLLTDKSLVKDLLEQVNALGMTPLALAAYVGNLEAIDQLYHEGAVFTAKDKNKNVLHYAILNGQLKAVDRMMKLASNETRARLLNDRAKVWDDHAPVAAVDLPVLYRERLKKEKKESGDIGYRIKRLSQIAGCLDIEDPIVAATRNAPADFKDTVPENLVFQGGGPKGLAYLGSLTALEMHYGEETLWKSVRRVAGTSAGAITAMLLACGHKPEFISNLISDSNFLMQFVEDVDITRVEALLKGDKSVLGKMMGALSLLHNTAMKDASWWETLNPSKHAKKTYETTGLCSGDIFRKWADKIIAEKLAADFKGEVKDYKNFTFGELKKLIQEGKPYKHLYVVATKIAPKPEIVIFNSEDDKHADVIIADAVRASMSIPLLFKPHARWIKYQGKRIAIPEEEYLDGGLIQNYPLKLFDKLKYQPLDLREYEKNFSQYNAKTLGFSMVEEKAADPKAPVETVKDLVESIAGVYWGGEQLLAELEGDNARTVAISNVEGVNLTSFSIPPNKQAQLIAHGQEAVRKFFGISSPAPSVVSGQEEPSAGDSKREIPAQQQQTLSALAGATNSHFTQSSSALFPGAAQQGKADSKSNNADGQAVKKNSSLSLTS